MAQDWPTKPIRLIVPQGPASTVDIVARTFGDELRKSLGQNIVVDNRTGAGGTIASAEAAHAAPDGYTMLPTAQGTMVFNVALYAIARAADG
jgi:tripartite-type tricarboxylate transporter receptor subunit TctC